MIRQRLKDIKNKEEFENRLLIDNLMEQFFINIMKDIEMKSYINSFNVFVIYFEYKNDRIIEYYDYTYYLIIFNNFINIFYKTFGVSGTRAKSFIKRMIIKYYKLEVKIFK